MPRRADPAELAIFNALFASIAEEMGVTLGRTAHSPNIKERRDYSCAVFDAQGRLVAQAAHIPVHLGAMPTAVRAAMAAAHPEPPGTRRGPGDSKGHPEQSAAGGRVEGFRRGDLVILNDPYLGGTHLPDITMVSPVFAGRALAGFVASRAHHADVGGISPGSMPLAEELLQEGLVIPPLKLYERGRLNRAAFDLILRNMRNPDERKGDLDAQTAAHRVGEARFAEIVHRYGLPHVRRQMRAVMDYARRMTETAIAQIPDGAYEFEDFLDDDGHTDEPVPIRVRMTIARRGARRGGGATMHCDFTGSSPQRPSSVNAVAAVTRSAVYYVVRCLLDESVPSNDGCFRPVTFTLPEASVVNTSPPHAVAAGNVETSQRIVDTVLGALAPALPHLIPAASAGTMNNVSIGGHLPAHPEPSGTRSGPGESKGHPEPVEARSFAYYETVGGGAGASPVLSEAEGPGSPGLSAVHTHMTNTMNTPVEALELAYPFRVTQYGVRRGSGGDGRRRGGDGIVRTWEFLTDATVSLLTDRRRRGPWGLHGGSDGTPGRDLLRRTNGEEIDLPSKGHVRVHPGDRLTVETPGGGGWGHATE